MGMGTGTHASSASSAGLGRVRRATSAEQPHIDTLRAMPLVQQTTDTSSLVSLRKMPPPESPDDTLRTIRSWPWPFSRSATVPSSRLPGLSTPKPMCQTGVFTAGLVSAIRA